MKKRFLSFLLAFALIFMQVNVLATEDTTTGDTTDTETTPETIVTMVKANNFATVVMSTTKWGDRNPPSAFDAYINKYRGGQYFHYTSVLTDFALPLNNKIQTVLYKIKMNSTSGGTTTDRYAGLYSNLGEFPVQAEAGSYDDTTEEYTALNTYVKNYWSNPASNDSFIRLTNIEKTVPVKFSGNTWYIDVTDKLLAQLAAGSTENVVLATSRINSKYPSITFNTADASAVPALEVTFLKEDIINYINSATEADITDVIDDIVKLGMLDGATEAGTAYTGSTVGSDVYVNADADLKDLISKRILEAKPEGGYTSMSEVVAQYDAAVPQAIMEYANLAEDAESMAIIINGLGNVGALSTSTIGYDKYANMSDGFKSAIAAKMYELKGEADFADTAAVVTAFDTAMSEGILGYANSVNADNATTVIAEIGVMSVIDTTNYELLSDAAKAEVNKAFVAAKGEADFADTAAIVTAFDAAMTAGILYEVNNATEETVGAIITNLGSMGIIDLAKYDVLNDEGKAAVGKALVEEVQATPVTTTAEIATAFADATNAGILVYINAATEETIGEVITNIGAWGVLDSSTMKYISYSAITDEAYKTQINAEMLKLVGGLLSLDEARAAYDTAIEKGTVNYVNSATADTASTIMSNLGAAGRLSGVTIVYSKYEAMEDDLKAQVNEKFVSLIADGAVTDLASVKTAYNEAMNLAYIYCTVEPEDYAMAILAKDSYRASGVNAAARTLGIYVNQKYTGDHNLHGHHSSIISSYDIPLKKSIKDMEITYFITTGAGDSGRYIPVFYQLTDFPIALNMGYYAGEKKVESTDESGAAVTITETTEEFAKVKEFTDLYWPASDDSYTSPGKLTRAGSIYQGITSGAVNKFAVSDDAVEAFKADEASNCITFATGRSTNKYMNYRMKINTNARIPKLKITYKTAEILAYANTATAENVAEVITNLGKSGVLDLSEMGYVGYTTLKKVLQQEVEEAIIADISEKGQYASIGEFLSAYDAAVIKGQNETLSHPDTYISFNDETANDQSGNGNDATIVGAEFTTGPDGTKALKVTNEFGKEAQQYLNMGEYDFGEDSFSIVFWMKAPNRGIEYEVSGDGIAEDAIVDFSTYTGTKGGVALSNKDFSTPDNAGFAFAAMPIYADFAYNMKIGENATVNADGIQRAGDSRWHQIAYVVNRAGNATLYVDNAKISETDVSSMAGSFGSGNLIFGADGLGQYGMNKGEFDEIRIYSSALEASKIEELYYMNALNKMNNDISTYLKSDSIEFYSEANVNALKTELAASQTFVKDYEVGNLTEISDHYGELDTYYNNFLNKDVNTVAAFGSDVHISAASETHLNAVDLKRLLQESSEWENPAKTIIVSGDVADVGADDLRYFFSHVGKWHLDGTDVVFCRGNHDEPAGSEKDTGTSYTRTQLKNMWLNWMDEYIDKSLELNQAVLNEDGSYAEPYYYSTDGAAHYISIDNYWPTVRKISDTQLAWVEKVLEAVSGDGKPIIVVQHLPLRDTTQASNGSLGLLEDSDAKLKALLKKYDNVFVLNGHSHHGLGSGSGTPFYVGDEEGGFWQINAPILASKSIVRGYEWASGYYINVRDGEITFRARDFENQKWLRDYDMTFALTPASESETMGAISLLSTADGTEYATVAAAAGKAVKVQVPVTFVNETATSFDTAFAAYAGGVLKAAKLGSVSVSDSYIEFELTLPADADEVKVMCWNTIENMTPVCTASVKY